MPKRTRTYLFDGEPVSATAFKRLSKEKQIGVMRDWFFSNFSDPNILPYDSSEGGFQWIWGGPFDAADELDSEFGGIAKQGAIDSLSSELADENPEWSGNPDLYEPDENEFSFQDFLRVASKRDVLFSSLYEIEDTVGNTGLGTSQAFIHMLLFANVITAMEAYLSDKFKERMSDAAVRQKFIETYPKLKEMKVPLSAVSATAASLDRIVANSLSDVVWHRLDKVAEMYSNTLGVTLPPDLTVINKAIADRHDIVHRNGLNKDGVKGTWDAAAISAVIGAVKALAENIERQLTVNDRHTPPPGSP
jgi:hypothetical protein